MLQLIQRLGSENLSNGSIITTEFFEGIPDLDLKLERLERSRLIVKLEENKYSQIMKIIPIITNYIGQIYVANKEQIKSCVSACGYSPKCCRKVLNRMVKAGIIKRYKDSYKLVKQQKIEEEKKVMTEEITNKALENYINGTYSSGERKWFEYLTIKAIFSGFKTVKEISNETRRSFGFTSTCLNYFEFSGFIKIDRTKKAHRIISITNPEFGQVRINEIFTLRTEILNWFTQVDDSGHYFYSIEYYAEKHNISKFLCERCCDELFIMGHLSLQPGSKNDRFKGWRILKKEGNDLESKPEVEKETPIPVVEKQVDTPIPVVEKQVDETLKNENPFDEIIANGIENIVKQMRFKISDITNDMVEKRVNEIAENMVREKIKNMIEQLQAAI